ncbi:cold shock protein, partial [Haematococcus lacustris]
HSAQVKWFNDKLGYGFCTITSGPQSGKDVFVHHTGILHVHSHFRTLRKGECVHLNISHGQNGPQGVDVS